MSDLRSLYETDFVQWIETTVDRLRSGDHRDVDWENLIDETEDMARSQRHGLKSNLIVVLLHLLKWQHQPEKRSGSWEASLLEHRHHIQDAIEDSPSLKPYLESVLLSPICEQQNRRKRRQDCLCRPSRSNAHTMCPRF